MLRNKLMLASLCFTLAAPLFAVAGGHEHAHGHDAPSTLQLDAGRKWPTDAALRASMLEIRGNMAAALHGIHERRLSAKDYAALAGKVEQSVGRIVAECKLDARADAQLHVVVAELLAGAEQMAGKVKGASRQAGAVRVIGALDKYAAYFDDPEFKPIAH